MRGKSCFFVVSSLAMTLALTSGCAVGPDYARPNTPDVSTYDYMSLPDVTADGAKKLVQGQDIPAEWWALFRSEGLNKLIKQAIEKNPDLASADAALRVALDNLSAGGATFYPKATGSFSSLRQKTSGASNGGHGTGSYYTLHNASVSVSYDLDLWGGTRRTVEKLQAAVDVARFQKEAAHLALTSNVATLAFTEASLREQIAAAQDVVGAQEKLLSLAKTRFTAGAVGKSAVVTQKAALAGAKAALPPLQHQLVVARHALSALLGDMPSKEPAAKFKLGELKLPHEIPVSLPSKLVEQRPDIRAAEENLHAASAAIGVAVAARLPSVSLTASLGTMANLFEKLLTPGYGMWSLGAGASETLFDAGALADKEQAARDAFDQATAQYRKTVLASFQEVADALHALQSDAESLVVKKDAEKAAFESLSLAVAQFRAGAISAANLFEAQIAERQARAALAQARAQRYADTAALFAALGGGWWNRDAAQSGKVSHD